MKIRKTMTICETTLIEGHKQAAPPLRMFAAAAVLTNPWSTNSFVDDLKPEIMDIAPREPLIN